MKTLGPRPKLVVSSASSHEISVAKFLSNSGTFRDGNLLVNKDGLRILPEGGLDSPAPLQPLDSQFSLADVDTIKVIGKGNGGVVQLVRHKWTGQFFALKVLKGLVYLHHEKHIIHRDIKPSNLLVNHRGEVKITDFGVSAILDRTSGMRDSVVGTYTYMSPERISAEKYSYKSDIWSLGLVLLECATGSFPYTPVDKDKGWTHFFELLEVVVDQPPPHAPSDQFTPEFCSFISACMQKNPEDRLSARNLLTHHFITKYECPDVNLASYLTSVGSPLATF